MVYEKYIEQFDKIGYFEDRIVIIPNFISKENLNLLNDFIQKYNKKGSILKENIDNYKVVEILTNTEKEIYNKVYQYYTEKYDVKFKDKAYIPTHLVNWNVSPGEPLPVHSDCERPDGSPAMHDGYYRYNLAVICYLNDDYSGGKIFFPKFNKEIKPNAGDLIMFPGRFRHGVTGVEKGDRYTMLTWFRFDVEDNILDKDLPYAGSALGVLFNNETGN